MIPKKHTIKKQGAALLLSFSLILGNFSAAAAAGFSDSGEISSESSAFFSDETAAQPAVDFSPAAEETENSQDTAAGGEQESSFSENPEIIVEDVEEGAPENPADLDNPVQSGDSAGEALFSSQPEDEPLFSSGETESSSEDLDYVLGRPMTEEEQAEQLAPMSGLIPFAPLENVESDLGISMYNSLLPYFDSRESGLVTSVKNQNPFGICWAFGVASNFETSLLSQGLGSWDLSEEHLAYFLANRVNDPLGNTPDDKLIHLGSSYHDRGNGMVASFFLSTWSSMVTEDKAPLPTDSTHTADLSAPLDQSLAYDTDVFLTDAVFSSYSEERMKLMVQEYGSVTAMIYLDSSGTYYKADTAASSYPASGAVNHAVTVIGWDDAYSKDNFPEASNVQNDGAWIVKNSYGSSWGDGGYFYLSYEDASITNLVSNTATLSPSYPNNYFYDGAAAGTSSVTLRKGYSIANIFTASAGNGNAEELGEIVVASKKDYTSYQIQIYTDLTDPSNPLSGTPAYESPMEYLQPLAGIDTVTLDRPITLVQGSLYSIVLTLMDDSTPYYVENTTTVQSSSWFQAVAGLEADQSFYSSNGAKWTDCGTLAKPFCFSIKAHTRTLDSPAATPTPTAVPTPTAAPAPTSTPVPTATPAPKSYQVTYNRNTSLAVGNMPSDNTKYTSEKTVTVKNAPYCSSRFFIGWNTKADGSGVSYAPGKTFKITDNVILYAQWRYSYVSSADLIFRVKGKNTVACCGTTNRYIRTAVIPSTIRYANVTYKVTSVWTKAFYGKTLLKRVVIGNNVTAIGSNAFRNCKNLNRISIGTGLTRIGAYAFRNVKSGCLISLRSLRLNNVGSKIDAYSPKMVIGVSPQRLTYYQRLFSRRSRTVTVRSY